MLHFKIDATPKDRDERCKGRGYFSYSQSYNALEAKENDVYPASHVDRILKLPAGFTKTCFKTSEAHHTSKEYNLTSFYDVARVAHFVRSVGGRNLASKMFRNYQKSLPKAESVMKKKKEEKKKQLELYETNRKALLYSLKEEQDRLRKFTLSELKVEYENAVLKAKIAFEKKKHVLTLKRKTKASIQKVTSEHESACNWRNKLKWQIENYGTEKNNPYIFLI